VFPVDLGREPAETLMRVRREAGVTQGEMARMLGLSRPTLNRLESASENVTLRTLGQLWRALRCSPGDLFRPGRVHWQRSPRPRRHRAR
jgi:DNA-binding Xre family transcriptional regulator